MDRNIAVIIPTYNEKENIVPLIEELLKLQLPLKILLIDDASPDRTGELAKKTFAGNPAVSVHIRKGERGRGLAGIFGYRAALETGSSIIGEMDGDFSHHPSFIPDMVAALENADAVIGSRYAAGGQDIDRGALRRLISQFARRYIRTMLGIKLEDPTSGFRFFKHQSLEKIVENLSSKDPFIVTEALFYLKKSGARICEIPIKFYERRTGESKLQGATLLKYLLKVLKLRMQNAFTVHKGLHKHRKT